MYTYIHTKLLHTLAQTSIHTYLHTSTEHTHIYIIIIYIIYIYYIYYILYIYVYIYTYIYIYTQLHKDIHVHMHILHIQIYRISNTTYVIYKGWPMLRPAFLCNLYNYFRHSLFHIGR